MDVVVVGEVMSLSEIHVRNKNKGNINENLSFLGLAYVRYITMSAIVVTDNIPCSSTI